MSEILDISAWFLNGIHSFFPNFDLRNHLKKHTNWKRFDVNEFWKDDIYSAFYLYVVYLIYFQANCCTPFFSTFDFIRFALVYC